MKIKKLDENFKPSNYSIVSLKRMGNITEIRSMAREPKTTIKKLDKNSYIDLHTGEIKEFRKSEVRTSHLESISRSMKNLRNIINTNVTDTTKCLFVTLTYKQNMTDTKKLYSDYRAFNLRFQRYLKNNNIPKCEYIACAEPQRTWCLAFTYNIYLPYKISFYRKFCFV